MKDYKMAARMAGHSAKQSVRKMEIPMERL
jgi:hypothetical protein